MGIMKRLFDFTTHRYRRPYDRRSGYDRRLLMHDPPRENRKGERREAPERRRRWKRVTRWSSANNRYNIFDPVVYRFPF